MITAGTRLGPYEIVAAVGAGGMGEVYRARDTKLNRDVALKILPDAFAGDPDRLARFTREAQTLAALNHPNIAHIHGLEEGGDVRALVMELVDGEDLAQRLARGPIPLDVQPFPGHGGQRQISTDGGTEPVWNRNGRELFYRSGNAMMAVTIKTQASFEAGTPRRLFEGPYLPTLASLPNYDVSPDGQRFLMLKPTEQAQVAPTQINVVLNWFEELKQRVPAGSAK
jgi:hypothetical protein